MKLNFIDKKIIIKNFEIKIKFLNENIFFFKIARFSPDDPY